MPRRTTTRHRTRYATLAALATLAVGAGCADEHPANETNQSTPGPALPKVSSPASTPGPPGGSMSTTPSTTTTPTGTATP